MKTILLFLPITLLATVAPLAAAQTAAADLLERGVYLEQTKGDIPGAIDAYERLIEQQRANRLFVARAHYRLGVCHLKQGDKSRAVTAFKTLIDEYPDQPELADQARRQMPLAFEETFEQIEENYFQDIDRRELMDAAIRAMMAKLDASSDYLDADSLKEYQRIMERNLSGIGAALGIDEATRELTITKPLHGSPAAAAGLLPGDRIVQIDGQPAQDMDLKSAVDRIRGPTGEAVTLVIRREGQTRTVRVVRGPITLERVRGTHRRPDGAWSFTFGPQGRNGYIRILDFTPGTSEEVRAALETLRGERVEGLVLDLRGNPGGLLTEALAVADLFLSGGVMLTSKGRTKEETWTATPQATDDDFRLAVLADALTASSGEVVCAALQDHGRAVVVGERTYGMGLIKSLIPLEGGASALKLPVATYYRPNGGNIHRRPEATDDQEWGVRPSPGFEVPVPEEERSEVAAVWERLEVAAEVDAAAIKDRAFQAALAYLNKE